MKFTPEQMRIAENYLKDNKLTVEEFGKLEEMVDNGQILNVLETLAFLFTKDFKNPLSTKIASNLAEALSNAELYYQTRDKDSKK